MHVEPLRRRAKPPENLRLNGQYIAVFARMSFVGQLPLERLHAPID
jgi:hypothetical protein